MADAPRADAEMASDAPTVPAAEAAPSTTTAAGSAAAAAAEPTADPPARGFPGFPTDDRTRPAGASLRRGLDAPPVPGGRDPAIDETIRRERPYVRLLVAMVAVIVGGSLLLTFLAIISAAVLR